LVVDARFRVLGFSTGDCTAGSGWRGAMSKLETGLLKVRLGGLFAAVVYDLFRLPFVLNGYPLFGVFPRFGQMLLGAAPNDFGAAVQIAGWIYHFPTEPLWHHVRGDGGHYETENHFLGRGFVGAVRRDIFAAYALLRLLQIETRTSANSSFSRSARIWFSASRWVGGGRKRLSRNSRVPLQSAG
jgi:hypothetical protein